MNQRYQVRNCLLLIHNPHCWVLCSKSAENLAKSLRGFLLIHPFHPFICPCIQHTRCKGYLLLARHCCLRHWEIRGSCWPWWGAFWLVNNNMIITWHSEGRRGKNKMQSKAGDWSVGCRGGLQLSARSWCWPLALWGRIKEGEGGQPNGHLETSNSGLSRPRWKCACHALCPSLHCRCQITANTLNFKGSVWEKEQWTI